MPGGSPETRGASEGGEAARPPPGPGFPESGHREEMAVPRPTHYAAQRGPTERPWRQRLRGSRRPPQASLLCSVPSARRAPRTPTRKLPTSSLSFSGTLTSCPPTSSLAWCCCASGSGPNATRCWTRCAPGSPDRCPRPCLSPTPPAPTPAALQPTAAPCTPRGASPAPSARRAETPSQGEQAGRAALPDCACLAGEQRHPGLPVRDACDQKHQVPRPQELGKSRCSQPQSFCAL